MVLDNVGGDYVEALVLSGTTAYGIDVFNHPAPPPGSGVKGRRGRLQPGQLLYVPSDLRHAIRNACPDSVAVTSRPWRTSVVQRVVDRMVQSWDSSD